MIIDRSSVNRSIYIRRSVGIFSHVYDCLTEVVLCDTLDTSILIVDTYLTIPVSPKSRYTAVYRGSKKYRETTQVSRVSTIPRVWDAASRTTGQRADCKRTMPKRTL